MRMKFFFVFIWILSPQVFAQNKCVDLFSQEQIDFQKLIISKDVYESYLTKISTLKPEVAELFSQGSASAILRNDQVPLTRNRLMNLLDRLSESTTREELIGQFREQLENYVPQRQITERIEDFISQKNAKSLERVLGDKTLQETQELVYGESFENPSAESLLGRYLAESNALKVSRQYPSAPGEGAPLGPLKSAVSVSGQSATLFEKYFLKLPELFFHFHTPNQGTLHVIFNGQTIAYSGANSSVTDVYRMVQNIDTILPMMTLSTSEANRLQNYVSLGGLNMGLAKTPWVLPGYTTTGGYSCCTHWIGEIPIGDVLVKEYTYPGRVDGYANQQLSTEPQTKTLEEYWHSERYKNTLQIVNNNLNPILQKTVGVALNSQNAIPVLDKLTQMVWTVPGRQHLAEMIGQQEAKLRGEFANPGYVAYTLIGRADTSRVPLVFHVIHDDSAEIPLTLRINAI